MEGSPRYSCRANRSLRSSGTGIGFTIARRSKLRFRGKSVLKGSSSWIPVILYALYAFYTCLVDNSNWHVSTLETENREIANNFLIFLTWTRIKIGTKIFFKKSLRVYIYIRDWDRIRNEFRWNVILFLFPRSFSHEIRICKYNLYVLIIQL